MEPVAQKRPRERIVYSDMGKRKLADELADLFNPAPRQEADPEAFGLATDGTAASAAALADDDEQLEHLDLTAPPKYRKAKEGSRLRADIDVGEDEAYKGRRSSRASMFGPEDQDDDGMEGIAAANGFSSLSDEEGDEEEEEQGEGGANARQASAAKAKAALKGLKQLEDMRDDDSEGDGEGDAGEDEDDSEDGSGDSGDEGEDEEEEEEGEEGPSGDEGGDDDDGEAALRRKLRAAAGGSELAELEREYEEVEREQEQGMLGLKQRTEKERAKGAAVLSQQKLYDRSLEQRILLQKVLQGSLRLPLGPLPPPLAPSGSNDGDGAASPSASGEEVEEQLRPLGRAYDELRRSAGATLVEMLRLQRALLLRSEAITSQMDPKLRQALSKEQEASLRRSEKGEEDENEEEEDQALPSPEDCWQQLQAVHTAVAPYRDAALDRWHRRTVLMNGLGPGAGSRLKALNQSVSAQVAAAMRDPVKLLSRSRAPADSCPRPLGTPATAAPHHQDGQEQGEREGGTADQNGDGDGDAAASSSVPAWVEASFDDGEFYQQLLKEFLSRAGAGAGPSGAAAAPSQKRRKVVDRRASKGRKIRYQVHDKLVNFMAAVASEPPAFAAQLFANLFGTSGAPVLA